MGQAAVATCIQCIATSVYRTCIECVCDMGERDDAGRSKHYCTTAPKVLHFSALVYACKNGRASQATRQGVCVSAFPSKESL